MCADGGLTMPAACAHRPSGRRLAAQGKLYLLTEQENFSFSLFVLLFFAGELAFGSL